MTKTAIIITSLLLIIGLPSCNDKNTLTEVVEVPISREEKSPMGNPADVKTDQGPFQMIPLPYSYDALEPNIDAKTMEVHYSKHHLGYANNLNKAILGTPLEKKTIEEILTRLDMENKTLRNNAGGYYNHNMFWEIIAPNTGGQPKGPLAETITKEFGSYANFKTQFIDAATKQFGSGWAWLVVNKAGQLEIGSTPNQDNPLMPNVGISGTPVLALDIWEHSYYLHYQNKRPDYINAFFNVINWQAVAKRYEVATAVPEPEKK